MSQPVIIRYAPNLYRLEQRQVLTLENAKFLAKDAFAEEGRMSRVLIQLTDSQREYFSNWESTVRDQMKDTPDEAFEWHSNLLPGSQANYLCVRVSKLSEVVEASAIGQVRIYSRPLPVYRGEGTFTLVGSKVWKFEVNGVMKRGIAWYVEHLIYRTIEKEPPARRPKGPRTSFVVPP